MIYLNDEYSYPLHQSGYASTLPVDKDENNVIDRLHDVVREITGMPVEKPTPRRIGFI